VQASIHLTFSGQCEAAFKFYARVLGGKIDGMLAYGDSPAGSEVPAKWRRKIVHASMRIGPLALAGADVRPALYESPRGFYVLLHAENPTDAKRIFRALGKGGAVLMPLQKTFWSPSFGALVDRFGTPWEISCAS
jgi:PhnB protein